MVYGTEMLLACQAGICVLLLRIQKRAVTNIVCSVMFINHSDLYMRSLQNRNYPIEFSIIRRS